MATWELVLPGGQAVPVGEVPLSIGRGPANEVVLADDGVSWNHAQLWVEAGTAWARDLGSRNGTHVNGARLTSSVRLADGDELALGGARLRLRTVGEATRVFRTRWVEDSGTNVRLMVRGDRFTVGSGSRCDLRIEGPDRAATLVFHDNGEIWVGTADGEWQVEPGDAFEVCGHGLRVVEAALDHAPTVEYGSTAYAYTLRAVGDGASGPEAVLADPGSGKEVLLTGNKGVLVYLLARRLARDREGRLGEAQEGWCTTDEVATGVWGRGAKAANHLNVLVHRLREQLAADGFDPWFLEKRRGGIRLRIRDVVVA